jgi:cell division initiation protein
MALSAEDVVARVFKQEFRGYDRDEVDAFLDEVAERLNGLLAENARLAEETRQAKEQAAEGMEAERLLKRTLVAAQRTADETVAEARTSAEEMRSRANADAERVLAEARAKADATVEQATAAAAELVAATRRQVTAQSEELAAAAERLSRATDELRRFRDTYSERVRAVVTEQLALLDRTVLPPLPDSIGTIVEVGISASLPASARPAVVQPDPPPPAEPAAASNFDLGLDLDDDADDDLGAPAHSVLGDDSTDPFGLPALGDREGGATRS